MLTKTGLFLILAIGIGKGSTITSTFGPQDSFTDAGGYQIGGGWFGAGTEELAAEFTPTFDAMLTQIRLAVFDIPSVMGDRNLTLSLSQGPLPGAPIETFSVTVAAGGGGNIYTFNSSLQTRLEAGQDYWLTVSSNDLVDNAFGWNFSNNGSVSVIADHSPGITLWQELYDTSPSFAVSGQPLATVSTVEPASALLASCGLILIAFSLLRRRRVLVPQGWMR